MEKIENWHVEVKRLIRNIPGNKIDDPSYFYNLDEKQLFHERNLGTIKFTAFVSADG